MNNIYFELTDNFENIIRNTLKDNKIIKTNQISTGWTNIVYEVKTTQGDYFFRFPRDEFWNRTIVKDYEFAKYIYGKTDFNTTKLELFYNNERPFTVHKKIPGIPLADVMNSLNNTQIQTISDEIAKFMYQLHKLNYNKSQIFTVNNIGLNLTEFLDELLNVHINKNDIKFWSPISMEFGDNCLVHGDLNSSNILLDNNYHISAIIDFGFGGFGNKYNDIGRIIGRCPTVFKNDIISSYEKYSNSKLDNSILNTNINTWTKIDNSYINYMKKIGIYE